MGTHAKVHATKAKTKKLAGSTVNNGPVQKYSAAWVRKKILAAMKKAEGARKKSKVHKVTKTKNPISITLNAPGEAKAAAKKGNSAVARALRMVQKAKEMQQKRKAAA